ncbi:MAG: C39 family peptidase [Bacillota bacterium]|nr:C39 family peptidase [Bacillota bacterium]
MNTTNKIFIKKLKQLDDEFLSLYRQERYPEALGAARKTLKFAEETLEQGDPFREHLKNNLKYAKREYDETAQKIKEDACIGEIKTAKKGRKLSGSLILLCAFISACCILGFTFLPQGPKIQASLSSDYAAAKEFISHAHELKEESIIEAPLIMQNPELPRGCEVTSLAMLLQYAGVPVDKLTLAKEIKKDPASYKIKNGKIYFGNPHYGFVGNMYSLHEPGYGVYHGPVRQLMEKYLPGKTIDLTGCEFEDLLFFLSEEIPVWVVINSTFSELAPAEFITWHTPTGVVQITYRMHSALLTGFDREYVYFNDPLVNIPNNKTGRESFQVAWEQMGKQAVTYLPY